MEIVKSVVNYKDYYVTNKGDVLSYKKGYRKSLKQIDNGTGYMCVSLSKKGKVKRFYVHRLVAESFLENKHKKEEVNHIDGIRNNNKLSNLEWVTRSENHYHRYKVLKQKGVNYGKTGDKNWRSKPVIKFDLNNNYICKYDGVMEAQRQTGITESNIRSVIYGKSKTAGGFKWKYVS